MLAIIRFYVAFVLLFGFFSWLFGSGGFLADQVVRLLVSPLIWLGWLIFSVVAICYGEFALAGIGFAIVAIFYFGASGLAQVLTELTEKGSSLERIEVLRGIRSETVVER